MRYKKLYPAVICFCVFLAAIGLVLVLVTNYIAKKIDPESGIM